MITVYFNNDPRAMLIGADAGDKFRKVWAGEPAQLRIWDHEPTIEEVLDVAFQEFNIGQRPQGGNERSMSTGDMIVDEHGTGWVCYPFGWGDVNADDYQLDAERVARVAETETLRRQAQAAIADAPHEADS